MAVHMMPAARHETVLSRSLMPLSMVSSGATVHIRQIRGGRRMKQRLHDLGLNPGATARVLKNDSSGPLIVAIKEDGRLALGRGMAHHIMVEVNSADLSEKDTII